VGCAAWGAGTPDPLPAAAPGFKPAPDSCGGGQSGSGSSHTCAEPSSHCITFSSRPTCSAVGSRSHCCPPPAAARAGGAGCTPGVSLVGTAGVTTGATGAHVSSVGNQAGAPQAASAAPPGGSSITPTLVTPAASSAAPTPPTPRASPAAALVALGDPRPRLRLPLVMLTLPQQP
jgi:hypothetical protein